MNTEEVVDTMNSMLRDTYSEFLKDPRLTTPEWNPGWQWAERFPLAIQETSPPTRPSPTMTPMLEKSPGCFQRDFVVAACHPDDVIEAIENLLGHKWLQSCHRPLDHECREESKTYRIAREKSVEDEEGGEFSRLVSRSTNRDVRLGEGESTAEHRWSDHGGV